MPGIVRQPRSRIEAIKADRQGKKAFSNADEISEREGGKKRQLKMWSGCLAVNTNPSRKINCKIGLVTSWCGR